MNKYFKSLKKKKFKKSIKILFIIVLSCVLLYFIIFGLFILFNDGVDVYDLDYIDIKKIYYYEDKLAILYEDKNIGSMYWCIGAELFEEHETSIVKFIGYSPMFNFHDSPDEINHDLVKDWIKRNNLYDRIDENITGYIFEVDISDREKVYISDDEKLIQIFPSITQQYL
jgi:hypothetical protein